MLDYDGHMSPHLGTRPDLAVPVMVGETERGEWVVMEQYFHNLSTHRYPIASMIRLRGRVTSVVGLLRVPSHCGACDFLLLAPRHCPEVAWSHL